MLKLPKGLKKKKKGKKSKKDQELFTEEELEQYKREQRAKQEAALEAATKSDAGESDATSDVEGGTSGTFVQTASATEATAEGDNSGEVAGANGAAKNEDDEEWAKFKALTSGVDSILHKTQKELDHIKQTSFYQRLPSAAEKKKQEEEEAASREAERLEEERRKAAEREANRDKLAEAVVELSESEEESEEADDIFATDYIDAITSGEVQLGVVPDSPVLEIDEGPDPFDTAYAEKVIVGADKAKGGKKLVSLGAAVEVLTGRVDRDHAVALSGAKRKPRKGVQDLLLDDSIDLEAVATEVEAVSATTEPLNLLDELADDIPNDAPIDLTASLHLQFLKKPKPEEDEEDEFADGYLPEREPAEGAEDQPPSDIVAEFDVLKDDEDDEFAELAAESLTKKEEVKVITQVPVPVAVSGPIEGDWAEFEQTPAEAEQPTTGGKAKPPRPPGPPPRPTVGPHIAPGVVHLSDDDEFAVDDDPFDTTFAEQVVTAKEGAAVNDDDDDFDFDPRAEERKAAPPAVPPPPQKLLQRDLLGGSNTDFTEVDTASNLLQSYQKDLLAGSTTDITAIGAAPIDPVQETSVDFDPFDTSAVTELVQPKEVELKVLEKELLQDSTLKHSVSDPDFDPRADEPPSPAVQVNPVEPFDPARRKSSLSLNLQSKTVGFLVPKSQDLLGSANDGAKVQKPLTPYYATAETIDEKESEDPFDTSFVPANKPSEVELKNLEQDLLTSGTLKHSLSDPDFDPRAPPTPVAPTDLLAVQENINIKVLTPAQESKDLAEELEEIVDPFDTSIAANIAPGKAELKLLESELLPAQTPEITTGVLDTLTDAQELGLGDKVLTPQVTLKESISPEDIDPFDTSIAENLGPGRTEIRLLENELIER